MYKIPSRHLKISIKTKVDLKGIFKKPGSYMIRLRFHISLDACMQYIHELYMCIKTKVDLKSMEFPT